MSTTSRRTVADRLRALPPFALGRPPPHRSPTHTARRYGPRWVVQAVLVHPHLAARPRARHVLGDLCRCEPDDRKRHTPHRAPAQLLFRLLGLVLPGPRIGPSGDGGLGAHGLARFCRRRGPG